IMPISSAIAMAGLSSDQKLAAIITPAVKPSAASSALRLTSLKKKTTAAPSAVTPHVKSVAARACQTGGHAANASSTPEHNMAPAHRRVVRAGTRPAPTAAARISSGPARGRPLRRPPVYRQGRHEAGPYEHM